MNNPNRCETCIGYDRPESRFGYSDTGVCGVCGQTTEVWDLAHLAALLVQGKGGLRTLGAAIQFFVCKRS